MLFKRLMLAAALAMSIGLRVRFVVLAFRATGTFHHVFAVLSDRTGRPWLDFAITRPSLIVDSVFPSRTFRTEVLRVRRTRDRSHCSGADRV